MRTIALKLITCAAALSLAPLGSGCGTSNCAPDLTGSAHASFDLCYDRIAVELQKDNGTSVAMRVSYLRGDDPSPEIPVRIVVEFPITEGTPVDMASTQASIVRTTLNQVNFGSVAMGNVTFDKLGAVGETSSGSFAVTFEGSSGTLLGDFSGKTGELGF